MALSLLFFFTYIAILVLIGWFASRRETEEGFMLADRKVAGIQLAATMSAGFFDGAILSIYLSFIYKFGFSAVWMFLGLAFGFLVLRKIAGPIKKQADRLRVYSMPEYFYRIFDKRAGVMFSLIIILQFFGLLIVNLIISGQVLSTIFPIPYFLAVVLGSLIVFTYLFLAGFKAVVKTDFFQLAIMFLMVFTVAVFLAGKTTVRPQDIEFTGLGISNLIAFIILGTFTIVIAPDLWQRMFAAKNLPTLRRGFVYSAIIIPILAIAISVVGFATRQALPNIQPEQALVLGFSQLLPFGIKELGLVLLYAVSLSSTDTITFVLSSLLTRDLQNYNPAYSKESMRKLTRWFMIFLIFSAALIAILYQQILVLGLALGSLSLALFPSVVGSVYFKLKNRAVFWSLVLGLLTVIILFSLGQISPESALASLPVALISLFILQKMNV